MIELTHFSKHGFGLLNHCKAFLGWKDRLLASIKEGQPVFLLELLELHAQSGLGDVAGLGRLAKVTKTVNCHEVFKLRQGRHMIQFLIIANIYQSI